ncbi:hypothetical protein K040078D81_26160 [Blautia hominis]|uniref:Uncharacterized protein n=1 Tax=Blautia hominis TaxID=2025493 RepID=A0ABQ0BAM1_9FIRM
MRENQLLELIFQELTLIKNNTDFMKEEIAILKEDVSGLKEDVNGLKEDITSIKAAQKRADRRISYIYKELKNMDDAILGEVERVHEILDRHAADGSKHLA